MFQQSSRIRAGVKRPRGLRAPAPCATRMGHHRDRRVSQKTARAHPPDPSARSPLARPRVAARRSPGRLYHAGLRAHRRAERGPRRDAGVSEGIPSLQEPLRQALRRSRPRCGRSRPGPSSRPRPRCATLERDVSPATQRLAKRMESRARPRCGRSDQPGRLRPAHQPRDAPGGARGQARHARGAARPDPGRADLGGGPAGRARAGQRGRPDVLLVAVSAEREDAHHRGGEHQPASVGRAQGNDQEEERTTTTSAPGSAASRSAAGSDSPRRAQDQRAISTSSTCGSTGLARWTSKPAARLFTRSASVP